MSYCGLLVSRCYFSLLLTDHFALLFAEFDPEIIVDVVFVEAFELLFYHFT